MSKVVCKGTVLQQDIASVYTALAQLISIEGPGPEVETFDATALDSGVGKEFDVTGYVDGGELSFDLFFDPALGGHQNLTDLLTTPVVENWKEIFSDATAWPFSGILTGLSPTTDMGDALKASCAIKLDGLVTYPT